MTDTTKLVIELFREKDFKTKKLVDSEHVEGNDNVDPRVVWRQRLSVYRELEDPQEFDFYKTNENSRLRDNDTGYLAIITFYDKLIEYNLPVPNHIHCLEYDRRERKLNRAVFHWDAGTLRQNETAVIFLELNDNVRSFGVCIDGDISETTLYHDIDISHDYVAKNETLFSCLSRDDDDDDDDDDSDNTPKGFDFQSPQGLKCLHRGEDIITSFVMFVRYYDLTVKKQWPVRAVKDDSDKTYVQAYKRVRVPNVVEGVMFYIGSSKGDMTECFFAIDPKQRCCDEKFFTIDEEKSNVEHPRDIVGKEFKSFSLFECQPVSKHDDVFTRLTCKDGSFITFKAQNYSGSWDYFATCWFKDLDKLQKFVI